jgi:hypothetical protein
MAANSRKPKKCVWIKNGPSCGFVITYVLLLKGPTWLPCLLYLAPISFCHTLFIQPCFALDTITINSTIIIPTLSNPNNSIHYCFFKWCCPSFKPYPKSPSTSATWTSLHHEVHLSWTHNERFLQLLQALELPLLELHLEHCILFDYKNLHMNVLPSQGYKDTLDFENEYCYMDLKYFISIY